MTSTIQSMGNDVKAPANETMTLDRMTDIWAKFTPEQRDVVVRMGCAMAEAMGSHKKNSLSDTLTFEPFSLEIREDWDKLDWPFKFGRKDNRQTSQIQEAHENRPD